jgi:hypothetical protein
LLHASPDFTTNSRFNDRFRQYVVVTVSHQMNSGDAFDVTHRPYGFDQNRLGLDFLVVRAGDALQD